MAEGQFLGSKSVYVYTDDSGVGYLVRMDSTLGSIPELGMVPAVDADLTKPTLPKGFSTRKVLWEGTCEGTKRRKTLTANNTSTAYLAPGSTAFDISGSTDGATTGRVGEKKSYLRLSSVTAGPAAP